MTRRILSWLICAGILLFEKAHSRHGGCQFRQELSGRWFQSGHRGRLPVIVNRTHFSEGECVEAGKANRYLIYVSKEECFKCMVINMKHHNVLQYKESFCYSDQTDLSTICHDITGDAMLFSMFRVDASPIKCPFNGPLTFSYSKGYGECNSPISQVDSCADDSRLLFRQQACPDVRKSESKEEELICLGVWSEGSNFYLAGKLDHKHAKQDEDRYRCFIYDKPGPHRRRNSLMAPGDYHRRDHEDVWYLAVSADASCQGLISAYEGSKTLKMRKAEHSNKKCKFPHWFSKHKKWHTLDYNQTYHIHNRNSSINIRNNKNDRLDGKILGLSDFRLVCHDNVRKHSEHDVTLTMHYSANCRSGYKCMRIVRRGSHTVQVAFGREAMTQEEACGPHFWDSGTKNFITLLSHEEHSGRCGLTGRYHIPNLNDRKRCDELNGDLSFHKLTVGCSSHNTLQIHRRCSPELSETYQCHSQWETGGEIFVVASPVSRASNSPRRVCFAYLREDSRGPVIISRQDTCVGRREDAEMVFNVTLTGKCGPSQLSRATISRVSIVSVLIIFLSLFVIYV